MKATKKDIGRKVEFRALTRWTGAKQTRIIKSVRENGGVTVRFGGYSDFGVRPHEIIEIYGRRYHGRYHGRNNR